MQWERLYTLYNTESDIQRHLPVLFSLSVGMRPKVIFEIGVDRGNSTLTFLTALYYLNLQGHDGLLYSVDVRPCENTVKTIIESQENLSRFWEFYVTSSTEIASKWDKPIDILFIDGDHNLVSVRNDFYNFFPFVKPGGFILLHDSIAESNSDWIIEVSKFLPELSYIKGIEYVTLPYNNGLTIVHKKVDFYI